MNKPTDEQMLAASQSINPADYPECDKVVKLAPVAQVVGDFHSFLKGEGIFLTRRRLAGKKWPGPRYVPIQESMESLLYRYFKIDRNQVSAERARMREEISTKAQEAADAASQASE